MTNDRALLSEITYGAFLAYSPRGQTRVSIDSRRIVRDGVKHDTPHIIRKAVERLLHILKGSGLEGFFGRNVILVPVPRRAPLRVKNALWPGKRICEELVKVGLGREILPCLERKRAVPKSAYAQPGVRPDPQVHFDSMALFPAVMIPEKITLVDDFVTRGSTLLAGTSHVQHSFPDTEVNAFALVRTRGLIPEIEKIVDPCVGRIWIEGGRIHRDP